MQYILRDALVTVKETRRVEIIRKNTPYHDEYEGCGVIRISSLPLSNLRQLSPCLGLRASFNKIGCFQCDIRLGLDRVP